MPLRWSFFPTSLQPSAITQPSPSETHYNPSSPSNQTLLTRPPSLASQRLRTLPRRIKPTSLELTALPRVLVALQVHETRESLLLDDDATRSSEGSGLLLLLPGPLTEVLIVAVVGQRNVPLAPARGHGVVAVRAGARLQEVVDFGDGEVGVDYTIV